MGFYVNNENKIINLNGKQYYLNLSSNDIKNEVLLTLDNFFLQDSTGVSLISKSL